MPAFKSSVAGALLLVLIATSGISGVNPTSASSSQVNSAASSAIRWLASNQSSTGSYGDYFEHGTATAAYAMWVNKSDSPKAALSYSWLATQLDSSSSWFWGQYGEADVPGAILHSIAASQNLNLITVSEVSSRLLEFRESNGGFRGYYDSSPGVQKSVTSSVDTALALWGLVDAGSIDASIKQAAVDYLFSLQNADGSFNLTTTIAFHSIYSQAPEPVSITSLVALALNATSFTINDGRVKDALDFLSAATSKNFTDSNNEKGHVYAASLTALALDSFGRTGEASEAAAFILSQQNSDGGFSDSIRLSRASNALDTGWAAIALQLVQIKSLSPDPLVVAGLIAVVAAPVGVLGVTAYYLRKRRKSVQ